MVLFIIGDILDVLEFFEGIVWRVVERLMKCDVGDVFIVLMKNDVMWYEFLVVDFFYFFVNRWCNMG